MSDLHPADPNVQAGFVNASVTIPASQLQGFYGCVADWLGPTTWKGRPAFAPGPDEAVHVHAVVTMPSARLEEFYEVIADWLQGPGDPGGAGAGVTTGTSPE